MNIDTREISLEPADNARLLSLCGPFDDNIKQLERRLGIEINRRDNHFKLTGRPICVNAAADILRSLYVDTAPMRGETQDIEPEQIHLAIKEARVLEQSAESLPDYGKAINIKTKRGVIKPRTPNQAQYIANILDHDITFGVGPAGTGKTYLAVAAAVDALERQEIRRILLTLGFDANLLKLLSASVVAVFLAVPYWKGRYFAKPAAKKANKEGANNA